MYLSTCLMVQVIDHTILCVRLSRTAWYKCLQGCQLAVDRLNLNFAIYVTGPVAVIGSSVGP